jgi:hypothetical protein
MRGRFLLPFFIVFLNYLPPGLSQGTGAGISTPIANAEKLPA